MALTKRLALRAALLLAAFPIAAQSQDIPENLKGTGEVVVASYGGAWEAAQKLAYFEPFTRDTGIKVVLVTPEDGQILASVKLGQPAADIDSITGGQLSGFLNKDAVEKIDYSFFGKETLAGIPENLRHERGLGAVIFSVVVAYNTNKFPEDGKHPKNWADFYNVEEFPGKRSLPSCNAMINGGLLEGALLADGVPPQNLYPLDMDRAFAKLKEFAPNVGRWWLSGADAPQSLINGEVEIAAAANGRIASAAKEGAPLALSWDQSLLLYDYWVVLKNSPNKENAFKFLAYISRPEPQAAFAKAISYGPVNKDAFKLLPKEVADKLPGAPGIAEKQIFQNHDWWGHTNSDGRTNLEVAQERCFAELAQ
ncbi:extracellular solute-binding protein [Sinorhizobium meliloti]|uniref:ABC transporter substrate-binding protein n=1 Tax=Rhizobium meliloti TaxID=382 RepID=UPI000FD8282F|nr:ABC transporter substrate-binding protein [Sinorhizobium meliloti]MDW9924844.1 extracellular solute-binding protein [Sinorhizobium meliloti]MDX0036044.1 extracellular solute-binding protein [Sinorhizobium meliloti]RVK23839.1 ABC transporter substrate-binding protein [Sinorhizobium meliloti]